MKNILLIIAIALLFSIQANADVMCISPNPNHGGLSLSDDGTAHAQEFKDGVWSGALPLTGKYRCIMNDEETGFFNLPHGKVETGISKPYVLNWTGIEHHVVDGKPAGLQTRWHSNSKKLSEVNLVNGKGLMTWWYPNGKRAAQVNVYVTSSRKGVVSINHGQIMEHYQMEGGYEAWYKDGNQYVSGTFNNGKLEVN